MDKLASADFLKCGIVPCGRLFTLFLRRPRKLRVGVIILKAKLNKI